MNKACASILIFVALFALASAEFRTLPLEQGALRMRNLATASTPSYNFDNYTNHFGIRVNLTSTFLTSIGLDNNTQTDMMVFLYTNATGFCYWGSQFVSFGCNNNNCSYDESQPQTMLGPNYYVSTGYPFNFTNLTIGNDSTNAAWKLNTTALYFSYSQAGTPYISTSSYSQNYIRNSSTYGFIGLGVGGNASRNFQTTNPIFSIAINGSGSGSLIFGKDTTLYDSKRTPMTFPTDTNWTMISRNMSLGPYVNNTDFVSNVIFDLQTPGVTVPQVYYTAIWNMLSSKYNLTYNVTFGNSDYTYTYAGALSNLPELTFGLTNGKNLTLPPSAYTRKLATDFYAIVIGYVKDVTNRTSNQDVNYTVIGYTALSQFYTVFELPSTGVATVTMYPTFNATYNGVVETSSSSFSLKTLAIVAAVVLIVIVALSAVCKKKNEFTKSDLGVELRAARV